MKRKLGTLTATLLLCASVLIQGCSHYSNVTAKAREDFYAGRFREAAKELEKGAQEEGVNQLLYILDRATALHHAGDYEEAIKEFRRADKLAEIVDYTSLSAEAATLVTNDRIIQYKGEDFEKVLINQYLALDYLFLGKFEDAQVESRRVNRKLYLMITEGKRKYKLNPMAKYLSGIIYEMEGQFNDAYIDYKGVYDLNPNFPYLPADLYRTALKSGLTEAAENWATKFGLTAEAKKNILEAAKQPELVVIFENGKSPEKKPHPNWRALPKYFARQNPVERVELFLNSQPVGKSEPLFNIESTAIENLDEKFAGLLAKRIAGVVTKEVIANQVDERVDPLLGAVLRIGMHAADEADLRSWLTLPKDFQVFRMRLAKPETTIKLKITSLPEGKEGAEKVVVWSDAAKKPLHKNPNQFSLQKLILPWRIL